MEENKKNIISQINQYNSELQYCEEQEKKEMEFRNGNGILKEYYRDGKLKFEGEYLNGKINGKAKEYS